MGGGARAEGRQGSEPHRQTTVRSSLVTSALGFYKGPLLWESFTGLCLGWG